MRSIFCFLLCVALIWGAQAQSSRQLDSLKRVLATLPPEGSSYSSDTTRVRVMCEMPMLMPFNQIDATLKFLETPLLISKQRQWPFGECMSYYWVGYFYVSKNDLMKGIDYLYRGLSIAEKKHFAFYAGLSNKALGDAYSRLGNYDKAKIHLMKSISIFKNLKNLKEEMMALNNLGLVYYDAKDYKTAILFFKHCLVINSKVKIHNSNNIFLVNLGASQRGLGNYSEALKSLEKVENNIKNNYKYGYRRVINLISIAEVWLSKGNFNKVKSYLSIIEPLQKQHGTDVSQKDIYWVYYNLYKKTNKPDSSLVYHENFVNAEKKLTQQDQQLQINNLQASFDNERKNTEINLLNQNIKQEALLKNIFISGAIFLLLFAIWFWRNNQILTKQNKIIERQSGELQTVNKALENLNQSLEQKVSERTAELQTANESLIKKNEEIVLAMVEGQTIERKRVASELHDNLGATLSAIKWRLEAINGQNLTEKEHKIYESTLEMMKGAYSEVRLISHNLLPAELEKGGLKTALEKFIADINSSGKLHISHNLQPEAIPTDKKTQFELYGIALELINNVLKHAHAQHAHVALYTKDDQTIFEVSDDGKGFDYQQNTNGMGSKNIQNRVEALNGSIEFFPQKIGMKIKLGFSMFHI